MSPYISFFALFFAASTFCYANTENSIEEVVVNGELRETKRLELTNAVSVLNSDTIVKRQARHLEDVLNLAPNLNFSSGASRGRFIQIRGIGERSQFTAPINPSVGIIVDGIDFTGIGTGVTTLDVEQVEIFRGPQGTLNGANALAGLINIHGATVNNTNTLKLSAGTGNFNSHTASAVLNLPISTSFGWRAGFQQNESDGFIDNAFLKRKDTNNIDEQSFRNHFILKPSDTLDLSLTSYLVDVDNGYDAFSLDSNTNANFRTTFSDQPGHDRQKTRAHALKINNNNINGISSQATLSYAESKLEYGYDEDWAYPNLCSDSGLCVNSDGYSSFDNYNRNNNNIAVDLRLLSQPNSGSRLSWVSGMYIRQQDVSLTRLYTFNPIDYISDYETNNTALYGQLNITLNGSLSLETGARVEESSAKFKDNARAKFSPTDTFFGGHITLKKEITKGLLYAKLSRGYKAGGFNPDNRVRVDDRSFESETLNNFEYGYTRTNSNKSLQANIVGFYQQRKDIQVKQSKGIRSDNNVSFIEFIDNAPSAENYGIEAEINWYINDSLALNSGLGLLKTTYSDYRNNSHVDAIKDGSTGTIIGFDMSSRDQAHAPNYQYTAGLDWQIAEPLSLRIEIEGKDSFYFSESNNTQSESYQLAKLSLSYALEKLSVTLWAKNISDEVVETRGFFFGNDPRKGYAAESYTQKAAPRTFGIQTSVEF